MSQTVSSRSGQSDPPHPREDLSLLFRRAVPDDQIDAAPRPAHFHDLHLDDVAAAVCGRRAGASEGYFRVPLPDPESVRYRQEAIEECEREDVHDAVERFADAFASIRSGLAAAGQLRYQRQRERSLLDTVGTYCRAVRRLDADLQGMSLGSAAWSALRDHLRALVESPVFRDLSSAHDRVRAALDEVSYSLLIHENRIKVARFAGEADLTAHVVELFDRFRDGRRHQAEERDESRYGFTHIDAQVLEHVAQLFPDPFGALADFWAEHRDFLDPVVARLGRESNVALAWVAVKQELARPGAPALPSLRSAPARPCVPTTPTTSPWRCGSPAHPVVTNAVELRRRRAARGGDRPQPGRQDHLRPDDRPDSLPRVVGLPGARARRPADRRPTTFWSTSSVRRSRARSRGKLKDDLIRMREILERVTPSSVVVLNEVFSSTTTSDALVLARRVLDAPRRQRLPDGLRHLPRRARRPGSPRR